MDEQVRDSDPAERSRNGNFLENLNQPSDEFRRAAAASVYEQQVDVATSKNDSIKRFTYRTHPAILANLPARAPVEQQVVDDAQEAASSKWEQLNNSELEEEFLLEQELERLCDEHLNENDKINLSFYLNEFVTNSCDLSELLTFLMKNLLIKLPNLMIKHKLLAYIKRLYVEPKMLNATSSSNAHTNNGSVNNGNIVEVSQGQLDLRLFEATARHYLLASNALMKNHHTYPQMSGLVDQSYPEIQRKRRRQRRAAELRRQQLLTPTSQNRNFEYYNRNWHTNSIGSPSNSMEQLDWRPDFSDRRRLVGSESDLTRLRAHSAQSYHYSPNHTIPSDCQPNNNLDESDRHSISSIRWQESEVLGVPLISLDSQEYHKHSTWRPDSSPSCNSGTTFYHEPPAFSQQPALILPSGYCFSQSQTHPNSTPPFSTRSLEGASGEVGCVARSGYCPSRCCSLPSESWQAQGACSTAHPLPLLPTNPPSSYSNYPTRSLPASNSLRGRGWSSLSSSPGLHTVSAASQVTGNQRAPFSFHEQANLSQSTFGRQMTDNNSYHQQYYPGYSFRESTTDQQPREVSFCESGSAELLTSHRRCHRRQHLSQQQVNRCHWQEKRQQQQQQMQTQQDLQPSNFKSVPNWIQLKDYKQQQQHPSRFNYLADSYNGQNVAFELDDRESLVCKQLARLPVSVAEQMKEQASNFVHSLPKGEKSRRQTSRSAGNSSRKPNLQVRRTLRVKIKKSKPILGIAIEGGYNVSGQLLPRIVCVHEEGAAYQCGKLRASDLILEVNGLSTVNMTHNEIAKTISKAYYQDPRSYIEFLIGESVQIPT